MIQILQTLVEKYPDQIFAYPKDQLKHCFGVNGRGEQAGKVLAVDSVGLLLSWLNDNEVCVMTWDYGPFIIHMADGSPVDLTTQARRPRPPRYGTPESNDWIRSKREWANSVGMNTRMRGVYLRSGMYLVEMEEDDFHHVRQCGPKTARQLKNLADRIRAGEVEPEPLPNYNLL